ncbi:MAG: hypothetical protein KDB82_09115 [Planctomycetes bacterium]|nr:hypothetical protein [Planctomycetota bacterium]
MNEPAANEIYALLVVEFDVGVDKVSRAMFAGKMVEFGWLAGGVANTWILEFEPRSRSSMRDTVRQHVEMATYSARIETAGVKAIAQFGDEEPWHS